MPQVRCCQNNDIVSFIALLSSQLCPVYIEDKRISQHTEDHENSIKYSVNHVSIPEKEVELLQLFVCCQRIVSEMTIKKTFSHFLKLKTLVQIDLVRVVPRYEQLSPNELFTGVRTHISNNLQEVIEEEAKQISLHEKQRMGITI